MKAMVLEKYGSPLKLKEVPSPEPGEREILIKVSACGVCRTDLHIVDQELDGANLPLILGHQIVGKVEKLGRGANRFKVGERVGAPWLGNSCHTCEFCTSNRENLCDKPTFTGYTKNGGFAEYACVHEDYLLNIPDHYDDLHAAPLLCAGLIGYRALKLCEAKKSIGFYGFGSSAHLLIQVAINFGLDVYVFTRPGDEKKQKFALSMGAKWAGGSNQMPPILLDGTIIFAPTGDLYVSALKASKKGSKVISAGIHMSDIPSFPYSLLWGERSISSVANLTREDGKEFMEHVLKSPIECIISSFKLEDANEALDAIYKGSVDGSVVLTLQ